MQVRCTKDGALMPDTRTKIARDLTWALATAVGLDPAKTTRAVITLEVGHPIRVQADLIIIDPNAEAMEQVQELSEDYLLLKVAPETKEP